MLSLLQWNEKDTIRRYFRTQRAATITMLIILNEIAN
jgi:hypothetical protein